MKSNHEFDRCDYIALLKYPFLKKRLHLSEMDGIQN